MRTLTDRITCHLLARVRRKALHELYETGAEAGLIESAFVEPGVEGSGLVWRLPEGVALTGEVDADRLIIARALRKLPHRSVNSADDVSFDFENVPVEQKGGIQREGRGAAADSPKGSSTTSAQRSAVLRMIREHLPRPAVAETAVALLLARAVGDSRTSFDEILGVLKRPDLIVVVRAAAHAFEGRFGRMLDTDLIIRGRFQQVDGFGNTALNGNYRDAGAGKRMITLSGRSVRDKGAELIRGALMKAWSRRLPMVIADELPTPLPARIVAGADLVLTSGGIDRALIIELMQHCVGVAPRLSAAALKEANVDGAGLGIDDLVLAVRPGRSAQKIADALKALELENARTAEGEDDGDGGGGRKGRSGGSGKTGQKTRDVTPLELVQPVPVKDQTDNDCAAPQHIALLVETLAGYGEARTWALDLKQDLALWKDGQIAWDEMSTKLLLSGPPGTGKTTYAKALCNSLQIPMLPSSVSTWLEPGYLGDVLKRMSQAFDTAREHAPAILFVDEIDNIGRRGHEGQFAEYWDSLVNRMLELLDGIGNSEGVIVVGATNRPEKLDPALLRSGRLETHVVIPNPDTTALAGILAHHLGGDLDRVLASRPAKEDTVTGAAESAGQSATNPAATISSTAPSSETLIQGERP